MLVLIWYSRSKKIKIKIKINAEPIFYDWRKSTNTSRVIKPRAPLDVRGVLSTPQTAFR